jgi:hypothetical protein
MNGTQESRLRIFFSNFAADLHVCKFDKKLNKEGPSSWVPENTRSLDSHVSKFDKNLDKEGPSSWVPENTRALDLHVSKFDKKLNKEGPSSWVPENTRSLDSHVSKFDKKLNKEGPSSWVPEETRSLREFSVFTSRMASSFLARPTTPDSGFACSLIRRPTGCRGWRNGVAQ